METDARYYRRRAAEELSAATRAVTDAARQRRLQLATSYLDRLQDMDRLSSLDARQFSRLFVMAGSHLPLRVG